MAIQHVSRGFGPNMSKPDIDRGSVTEEHQLEMAYGESNGHVTDWVI